MQDCLEDCSECELKTLIRVPSMVYLHKKTTRQDPDAKRAVGSVVKEFIEDAKRELHNDKEILKKETYEQ